MSNEQLRSLWVIHWGKYTCRFRKTATCFVKPWHHTWISVLRLNLLNAVRLENSTPQHPLENRCFLSCPPNPAAPTGFFSTYLTHCVFSTPTTTLVPKIALSTSHPLHRDKGSWKEVKGVKVSPHQSGRFCHWVAGSHSSASVPPPNDSAMTTLYQSKALLLWPHKLPAASIEVRDRQKDYTARLLVIIQPRPALSTPSSPSCLFLPPPPVYCIWPPLHLFVNNKGALWEDEQLPRNKSPRLSQFISMGSLAWMKGQVDWTEETGHGGSIGWV